MKNRKTVTLTEPMSKKVTKLAEIWDVTESEAMRRLFGLGSFLADELLKGSNIMRQDPSNGEVAERLVFPDLQ